MRITEKEYLADKQGVEKQLGIRLYSRTDISETLNVSKEWLDKLVKFGEIPNPQVCIGRFKLFTEEQYKVIENRFANRVIAV